VVAFVFSHSKLRKQRFLLTFSKSRGALVFPALPSDAMPLRMLGSSLELGFVKLFGSETPFLK